ncbi:hypothetical protein [Limnofasciculus baicalensis]|uniref:Uncharacterized protein n=1 Tax=Limnofasciculus baicalensis BBK-W-15 TaxID=2699891 RepID=A0AAE3GWG1_9CYAN|nr:hypothetical protein [Limnofasciculus baicalensis]MCP2731966.1 hypothetical protein [Limnofasciculus baicalensis BBK-W-15]
MTNQPQPDESTSENVHSVTDPIKCKEMGQKYGWKLKDTRQTKDSILKIDCIFYGKQTSFEDERYD